MKITATNYKITFSREREETDLAIMLSRIIENKLKSIGDYASLPFEKVEDYKMISNIMFEIIESLECGNAEFYVTKYSLDLLVYIVRDYKNRNGNTFKQKALFCYLVDTLEKIRNWETI